MIVTINTDASWCSKTNLAGYAFWIVSNEGRICHSGVLKKKVSRPEIAEFKCILNAVHVLWKTEYKNVTKVIINTDCLNVIHLLKNDKAAIQRYQLASWGRDLVMEFDFLIRKMKIQKKNFDFRHVRAHESTSTKRQFVNNWCDENAKAALHKGRLKLTA